MKEITVNGKNYKQVQKRTAERMYNNGEKIYMVPCKTNPYSTWVQFMEHTKHTVDSQEFTKLVNEWEYYNCNTELGKYPHFYIEN